MFFHIQNNTMQQYFGRWVTPLLIGFWVLTWAAAAGAAPPIDPDLIKQARSWQFGQSREPLERIADQIAAARAEGDGRIAEAASQIATLLVPDATRDGRDFACRMLARIGTGEQAPALAGLLDDAATFDMALYALDRIPGPGADATLVEALSVSDLDNRRLCALLHALARRGAPAAIPKLVELARSNRRDVAESAIHALGAIGGAKAEETLLALLRAEPDADALPWAAAALLRLADGQVQRAAAPAAARLYQAVLDAPVDQNLRAAALRGWIGADSGGSLERALEAMADEEQALRRVALEAIRILPGAEVTSAFADAMVRRPSHEQPALLEALADRRDPAALDAVSALYDSPDEAVRVVALRALGRIGDRSVIERLATRTTAESEDERQAARAGLRAVADPEAQAALVALLARADVPIQVEILAALADRQDRAVASDILQWATSDTMATDTRVAALRALQTLGDGQTAPALLDLVVATTGPEQVGQMAARTFIEVARRNLSPADRTGLLRHRLATQDPAAPTNRSIVLRLMGELGDADSLDDLRQACADRDEAVAAQALRALVQWPTAAPRDFLRDLARSTVSPGRRIVALRGFIRAIGLSNDITETARVGLCAEAMDLARGREEIFAVLALLGATQTPEALDLVLKAMDRDDVVNEAALAVCRLALGGGLKDNAKTMAALDRALERPLDEPVENQVRLAREKAGELQGYLLDWQVAGPYWQEGKSCTDLFDIPFGPEIAEETVTWRPMPVGLDPDRPWYLDLLTALDGGVQRVAYLRTRLHRPAASQETLLIGSDDGVKVWLNGQMVHANNTLRPLTPGSDRVEVTLAPGENILLFKITQNDQPWGASARIAVE